MMRRPDPFDREDKSVSPEQDKRTRELTNSSNDASGSKARRTDGKFPAENDDNEFGIFHTVSSAITPLRNKALSLTISCTQRLISKLELNNLPTYIEQIIATASEKHNAAVAAANANNERLGETALAVKQREFNKLANLWVKVAEISSLLKDETNQLRELTKKMELSQSLLQRQREIGIEQSSLQKKQLAQDEMDLLTKTIVPHEKMVNFLFRGTSIMDEWIHKLWTKHLILAVSSSRAEGADDPGIEEEEKENCYKNSVAILQIFAANHSEDEDQEIASFFATVAESEYERMQSVTLENQDRYDEIIERNKSILTFCSIVDSLQEKIRENKGLANGAIQERVSSLYGEAVEWHRENYHLIMSIVEQLISGNEVDLASSENRSKILNELASGAEAQARRIEQLSAEKGSLRFGARIVNETSGGK